MSREKLTNFIKVFFDVVDYICRKVEERGKA
jgi:hypothetical protein